MQPVFSNLAATYCDFMVQATVCRRFFRISARNNLTPGRPAIPKARINSLTNVLIGACRTRHRPENALKRMRPTIALPDDPQIWSIGSGTAIRMRARTLAYTRVRVVVAICQRAGQTARIYSKPSDRDSVAT